MSRVIVDIGPLAAYLDRDAEFHGWACDRFRELTEPLFTCEAVLTETLFLLKRGGLDPDAALALVERGALICDFTVGEEIGPVRRETTAIESLVDVNSRFSTSVREASGLKRVSAWLAWRAGAWARSSHAIDRSILDRSLRAHARAARRLLATTALRIDRGIRIHGRSLADRQLEIGLLSRDVRDLASILAVTHHADASGDDRAIAAADCWCRAAIAHVSGTRATPADHAALAALGSMLLEIAPA